MVSPQLSSIKYNIFNDNNERTCVDTLQFI